MSLEEAPQLLYHGTGARYLDQIKAEGLRPRAARQKRTKGNYPGLASNKGAVYLTVAWPWCHASNASSPHKGTGLVLEVDRSQLEPIRLCPDEDALAYDGTKADGHERIRYYRKIARYYPEQADESLKFLGNCAYYGIIPWSAVTRYVLLDWDQLDGLLLQFMLLDDINGYTRKRYRKKHDALIRWAFGGVAEARELQANPRDAAEGARIEECFSKLEGEIANALAKRAGITLVTNNLDNVKCA